MRRIRVDASGPNSIADSAANAEAMMRPIGVASSKPAFFPSEHSGRGERVQAEEAGAHQARERDEEEAGVAAPAAGAADGPADGDACGRRGQHRPEVRRVALPDLVDVGPREQGGEGGDGDGDRGDPYWADGHWPCMYKADLARATRTRYAGS